MGKEQLNLAAKALIANKEAESALADAIKQGNYDLIEALLMNGMDVNNRPKVVKYYHSPLTLACIHGDLQIVVLLLKHKADPNIPSYGSLTAYESSTPIDTAAIRGHTDIVKTLLDNNAYLSMISKNTLRDTIKAKHANTAKLLLERGVTSGINEAFIEAIANHNLPMIADLLRYNANPNALVVGLAQNTLLIDAIANNRLQVAKLLLDHGAYVDAQNLNGVTALMKAAKNGNAAAVNLLMKYQPEIRLRAHSTAAQVQIDTRTEFNMANNPQQRQVPVFGPLKEDKDILGLTAVEIAQKFRHPLNFTTNNETSVQSPNKDKTIAQAKVVIANGEGEKALLRALATHGTGGDAFAQALIENGANVNCKESICLDGNPGYNMTPLLLACIQHNEKIVALLLKQKADVNLLDPVSYSILSGFTEIVRMLFAHGAKINDKEILCKAVEKKYTAITHLILEQGFKEKINDAMKIAFNNADLPIMADLLAHGALADTKLYPGGNTLLIEAIKNDQIAIAELLLKYGAYIDAKNIDGCTALMKAAKTGNMAAVDLLLQYKPTLNLKSNEKTDRIWENSKWISHSGKWVPYMANADMLGLTATEIAHKFNHQAVYEKLAGLEPASVRHTLLTQHRYEPLGSVENQTENHRQNTFECRIL